MCSPAAIGAIGLLVAAGSTAVQITGQQKAARAASRLANRELKRGKTLANDAVARGRADKEDSLLRLRSLLGQARSSTAAGELALDVGTPLFLDAESIALGQVEAERIKGNALREAYGISTGARVSAFESRAAARQLALQSIGTGLQGAGQSLSIVGGIVRDVGT